MNHYKLKITIPGVKGLARVIEATDDCTFDDLHEAVFDAFDREEEHLYSFFITKKDTASLQAIYDAPEITHPYNTEGLFGGETKPSTAKIKLSEVGLSEKDVFYYLFDFGDEWWHRIRVESIVSSDQRKGGIKLIKSVGQSPPQYAGCYDDADDGDAG